VAVRIITDNECVKNKGSDILFLAEKGIVIRTDTSIRGHVHHNFVVIDDEILITGSFKWTSVNIQNNQENLVVIDYPEYIDLYNGEFEKLWKEF
jgi:phosphatidylserine/phosphatidylglycerophosphate/cardiolipin synthase-like enzyme